MSGNHDDDLEKAQASDTTTNVDPEQGHPKTTKAEVQQYTFFNKNLQYDPEKHGDIYDPAWRSRRKEWAIDK